MAAIELELIAAMLQIGDLSLIHKGEFKEEHCLTTEGKAIHHFLSVYNHITGGQGDCPTRDTVIKRFSHLELPEAPYTCDLGSLMFETRVEATRADLREYAMEVAALAEAVDPIAELGVAHERMGEIMMDFSEEEDYSFETHLDTILEHYADNTILPSGIPWPWPSLTNATRGMQQGDFIIISGRPKTRKTFIALAVAVNAFVKHGSRVLVFTPEMHPYMILLRAAAIAAHLRYAEFKTGELTPEEEMSLLEVVQAYGKLDTSRFIPAEYEDADEINVPTLDPRPFAGPMFRVIKSTNRPVSYLKSKIKQWKPHLVLCDSFYRQAGEGATRSDSDVKVLTGISRHLKDVAAEEGIALMGTHQINRDGAKKVGDLSNLAYADAFGQDADLVLRVFTERRVGEKDRSALALLGAREVDLEGVLINNVPCSDFTEIEEILDIEKTVKMLMQKAEDEEDEGKPRKKKLTKEQIKAKGAVARVKEKVELREAAEAAAAAGEEE